MLKLKKVQILGFKSFCDRTEVQLDGQGIAAVVGPNGCGKSNIADAITWVLGEQSAKSLRGLKMEDVIFAGTRERKPTGMAEVSLTLVDPDVYDGSSSSENAPDQESLHIFDWDEGRLRRQNEADTEEAVAEAQPGTALNEPVAPASALSVLKDLASENSIEEGDPALNPSNVVLKIRRRKFGRSPTRAGELTITRRLFRSGDSEYLLNGKICRLRDIQDIFMGTGLGGESYAIIGQERIGQILSAKPQDRRSIIEEAAGITRFKTKKRLAELRLEASRQNLARVNDIFEEVTRQVGSLKRQAAKAERYGHIRDELRVKLRVVLASRIAQLDIDQARAAEKISALTLTIDDQAAQLGTLDAQHGEGVRRGYALDQQIRERTEVANQSAVELERITARSAANQDRVAELTVRLTEGAAEIEAAQDQLASLTDEQEQQRSFLASASADAQGSHEAAVRQQVAARDALRTVQAAEQQAEQSRRQAIQLLQRIAQIQNERAQAEASLAALDLESDRLIAESATAREELAALGLQRGQARLSFESVTDRLKRLELEISELRLAIESTRAAESTAKRHGDHLRGEIATFNGRRNSLEGLIRDHSYSTETVKNIFRAGVKRTRETGQQSTTLGTLADFLEVEGAYEQIVDEFLRDELNYIVVKDWDAADEGIRLLKSEVAGRATFLVESPTGSGTPYIASETWENSPEAPSDPQEAKPLTRVIKVLNGFGRSLELLIPKLRHGFIAADSTLARSLAAEHPHAWFLTPTGEAFHHTTVTGGRPSSGGPLALKRELREVESRLKSLEQELASTDTRAAELQHELNRQITDLDARNHERRDAEHDAANSGAALRQMESESSRIERRLQEWMLSTHRNRDARNAKADLIENRRQQAAALEAERAAHESGLATLVTELDRLRASREELQLAAAAAAAALAGLEERRRSAQAAFEQTTRLLTSQQQHIAQVSQQLQAAAAERLRREEETVTLAAQHTQATETRRTALTEVARFTAEARALRDVTTALDAQLRTLRTETETLREERSLLSAAAARLGSDIEHMEATCLNDLGLPAPDLRADHTIIRIVGETLNEQETETRALRHRLESMGPVNMMALEEYQESAGRHAFLETQRKDLLESIDNTQASIKEIDDVSRVKFEDAYKVINENFALTFARLFGGGQAFMRLTDEENRAEAGIEIVASPPGKKLQNILLLSGGEKALTALALLVGIFQFQPAPFCILDEVDAPLDESNVGRYATMISEMAASTQFIAITHSRRTMQQADVIYGVTMQEPGVSKIVSVNLGHGNKSSARGSRAA